MTIRIDETTGAVEAAAVLELLPARPRLLAVGEPTHGAHALLELRNEMFRQLVEQHGYRTIALESDCLRGLLVDEYVTSGTGDLDEVMARGLSHEWGGFPANRALVRWMREFNIGRPADQQVRFAGVDGPLEITGAESPRQSLTALHAHLAARLDADLLPCTADTLERLLGPDDRWTEPAAMLDPSRSVGRTPAARELRLLADDLVALLDAQAPRLHARSTRDQRERVLLYGRTATGLLRYHYWMAEPSPSRMGWLLGVRDSMMAANLLAVVERGPALVNAHNAHLQRHESSMRMGGLPVRWWSAGAIVSAQLGEGYAFLASALGTLDPHGVHAPDPDTVEGLLYASTRPHCLVDTRRLAAALGEATPAARVSPWYGYAPLDPAHLEGLDGIVFVRDAG